MYFHILESTIMPQLVNLKVYWMNSTHRCYILTMLLIIQSSINHIYLVHPGNNFNILNLNFAPQTPNILFSRRACRRACLSTSGSDVIPKCKQTNII